MFRNPRPYLAALPAVALILCLAASGCKETGKQDNQPPSTIPTNSSHSPSPKEPKTAPEIPAASPTATAPAAATQRFVQIHRKALAALSAGHYQEAVAEGMSAVRKAEQVKNPDPIALAQAHATLAEVHLRTGAFELAISHVDDARGHLGQELAPILNAGLARLRGQSQMRLDQFDAAHSSLAAAAAELAAATGETTIDRSKVELAQGRLAYLQGDHQAAEIAVAGVRKKLDAGGFQRTPEQVKALLMTALLRASAGENDIANGLAREALALAVELFGKAHPEVADTQIQVATIALSQGRFDAAYELARAARKSIESCVGQNHPLLVPVLNIEAAVAYAGDDLEGVERRYKEALAIYQGAYGDNYSGLATYLNNLGMLLTSQQRYEEAVPLFARALVIDEATLGPDHIHLATTLSNLAILADSMGSAEEAEKLYSRALAIQRKRHRSPHDDVASTLASLANMYTGQERYKEALAAYLESTAMLEKTSSGRQGPTLGMAYLGMADIFSLTDRDKEAEATYRKALDKLAASLGPNHPYVALAHSALGEFYDSIDRVEEAQEQMDLAASIMEGSGVEE
jgi:tetratricopeptide (TPR) repeat protein